MEVLPTLIGFRTVGFIDWLGGAMLPTLSPTVSDLNGESLIVDTATPRDFDLHRH